MPSLSKIFRLEFNSAFLRGLLSFFYKEGKSYSIPFGLLKGLKIWYDKTINFHAILGLWERDNFVLLNKIMTRILAKQQNVIVFDVGANIGLFSLFCARVKSSVKVVAFEAAPTTVVILERNLMLNAFDNVEVINKAVSDSDNGVSFFVGHHHKSSLVKDWASDRGTSVTQEIQSPSVMLDTFVKENPALMPDIIKIDVEGGGDKVISGLLGILNVKRPVILFESHIPTEDDAVVDLINKFNYKAFRVNNNAWVLKETENYKHPDGVYGTMFLLPKENVHLLNNE